MVVEVGEVGDVGGGEVADEEGALPVHVLDVGALLAGFQRPRRELLELGLAAAGVVRLGQPLHLVHQLGRDSMVQNLHRKRRERKQRTLSIHGRKRLIYNRLLVSSIGFGNFVCIST